MTGTIGQLDDAMSPFLVRNDPHYPFQQSIGFKVSIVVQQTCVWYEINLDYICNL